MSNRKMDSNNRRPRRRSFPTLRMSTISLLLLAATAKLATAFTTNYAYTSQRQQLYKESALYASSTDTTPSTDSSRSSRPVAKTFGAASNNRTVVDTTKIGNWEELHGNFLLRPPVEVAPRALIHFLGGALVGASPHVSYRYLLERLAAKGYVIVATPYDLSFDHLNSCDAIISRFERIAGLLARTYGALPVVGVGHSCGALLQVLITSLFPDTPRAANALISYNNKPVSEAVPVFEEVVAPFFTYVAARNATNRIQGSEFLSVGLELAQAALAKGEVPSDELLSRATKVLTPVIPIEAGLGDIVVPTAIRNAVATLTMPSTTALTEVGVLPIVSQILRVGHQIPLLIDEVADGARDFCPPPEETKAAIRRAYRARRTLIVQYTSDPIDESDELNELLKVAGQVAGMKRNVDITLQRRNLDGGHAAPLVAPPLDWATRAEDLLGDTEAKERLLYQAADKTVEEIVRWLEEANL